MHHRKKQVQLMFDWFLARNRSLTLAPTSAPFNNTKCTGCGERPNEPRIYSTPRLTQIASKRSLTYSIASPSNFSDRLSALNCGLLYKGTRLYLEPRSVRLRPSVLVNSTSRESIIEALNYGIRWNPRNYGHVRTLSHPCKYGQCVREDK